MKNNKEKNILENFVKIFNKIKRLDESDLDEISYNKRQNAINIMKSKGQEKRADKWTQYYGTKDLEQFKDIAFKDRNGSDLIIYGFNIDGDKLNISYGSPRDKQFNRQSGSFIYYINHDTYGTIGTIDRKLARILSKIAVTLNPNTKYKNGIGDFEIIGY